MFAASFARAFPRFPFPGFFPASLALALSPFAGAASAAAPLAVLPAPMEAKIQDGRFPLTAALTISVQAGDERVRAALDRLLLAWEQRTGFTFAHEPDGNFRLLAGPAALAIACDRASPAVPAVREDESYALTVAPDRCTLHAATAIGALRGLATLQQLLQSDASGWFLPAVVIQDQPRFPWRGLLIDVARHWQPIEVIERNLDGMALVKLNVLHLHLTDDQGFRIESKKFPRLHEVASDGNYFTQDQMRGLIASAAARGIRVVPEFDVPGHATSWVTAFPELASAPGPYALERKWGVFDPVLDPTNPKVYELLDGFFGEMAALFPDPYLHIGGDENNGKQWNASAAIQAFIRQNNLHDNAGLHAWFNQRVHAILTQHGKRLIGWDEILHRDLPADCAVHSWRGAEGVVAAARLGHEVVLSHGYYIDLCLPTAEHYLNDPVPAETPLTPGQQRLVLGGEATMWSEWVSPETIDSRIWPRTAAIAERLWSPREVTDLPSLDARLALVSRRLDEVGLRHERYLDAALRRLAGDDATADELVTLRRFVDLLEPVKHYRRGRQQPGATQFTPLTGLADCARPDSAQARLFERNVSACTRASSTPSERTGASAALQAQFSSWRDTAAALLKTGLLQRSPRLKEAAPLAEALLEAANVGDDALRMIATGAPVPTGWAAERCAAIARVAAAHAACEIPEWENLQRLVIAAGPVGEKFLVKSPKD